MNIENELRLELERLEVFESEEFIIGFNFLKTMVDEVEYEAALQTSNSERNLGIVAACKIIRMLPEKRLNAVRNKIEELEAEKNTADSLEEFAKDT